MNRLFTETIDWIKHMPFMFWFMSGFTVFWIVMIFVIAPMIPPDTRSEFQKVFDSCAHNVHERYMEIRSYGKDCDALMSVMLDNGWKISSTSDNKYGDIVGYVLSR